MQYSNTTNESGLLQRCEFWTGLGKAGITGDATLKAQFTVGLNSGFDRIMPVLLSKSKGLKWDDINHTDHPVARFNLINGTSDYTFKEDDNALDIFNVIDVSILPAATATEYLSITEMTADHPRALRALSPNPSDVGVPTHYLKRGPSLAFYPQPNYSATNGVKISFEREQSYFATTDTIKEPGIPKPYHELLALYASYDWIIVNKSNNSTLITRLEAQITRREKELGAMIEKSYPVRYRVYGAVNTRV